MPKKIYIAGPMRGHKLYNFPAFDAAEARLRRLGYDVVNHAALDRARGIRPETFPDDWDWENVPDSFDLKAIALECIERVSGCHGMFLLNGWVVSGGAKAEHQFACWIGIPCIAETRGDFDIKAAFGGHT